VGADGFSTAARGETRVEQLCSGAGKHATEGEESHGRAGEKCEEERAAERSCYRVTAAPIPQPPTLLRGEVRRGERG